MSQNSSGTTWNSYVAKGRLWCPFWFQRRRGASKGQWIVWMTWRVPRDGDMRHPVQTLDFHPQLEFYVLFSHLAWLWTCYVYVFTRSYSYPQNERELYSITERAVDLSIRSNSGNIITEEMLWYSSDRTSDLYKVNLFQSLPILKTFARSPAWPDMLNFRFTVYICTSKWTQFTSPSLSFSSLAYAYTCIVSQGLHIAVWLQLFNEIVNETPMGRFMHLQLESPS